jgi:hypothetical protein
MGDEAHQPPPRCGKGATAARCRQNRSRQSGSDPQASKQRCGKQVWDKVISSVQPPVDIHSSAGSTLEAPRSPFWMTTITSSPPLFVLKPAGSRLAPPWRWDGVALTQCQTAARNVPGLWDWEVFAAGCHRTLPASSGCLHGRLLASFATNELVHVADTWRISRDRSLPIPRKIRR